MQIPRANFALGMTRGGFVEVRDDADIFGDSEAGES
jgi:hypothetical protein